MSSEQEPYRPQEILHFTPADEACCAIVILPARNEEDSLPATLDALATQRTNDGSALRHEQYEILLLLNNCTDRSAAVASEWMARHPDVRLLLAERTFDPEHAHVGTARRLLMDTAWSRLQGRSEGVGILSTDCDTVVAPNWISANLRALAEADAVGGVIELKAGELDRLPEGARRAYLADREYQLLVAELEDLLDPQASDPWPRHLEHFGASLACTPAVYAKVGGMPAVNPLEDMAFVDRLRRKDARLRHDPEVRVFTSSRFDGRASVGLSWQLRTWQHMHESSTVHNVPSAEYLEHRFRLLCRLRTAYRKQELSILNGLHPDCRERILAGLRERQTLGDFLGRIDCNGLVDSTFEPAAQRKLAPIQEANVALCDAIDRARASHLIATEEDTPVLAEA